MEAEGICSQEGVNSVSCAMIDVMRWSSSPEGAAKNQEATTTVAAAAQPARPEAANLDRGAMGQRATSHHRPLPPLPAPHHLSSKTHTFAQPTRATPIKHTHADPPIAELDNNTQLIFVPLFERILHANAPRATPSSLSTDWRIARGISRLDCGPDLARAIARSEGEGTLF